MGEIDDFKGQKKFYFSVKMDQDQTIWSPIFYFFPQDHQKSVQFLNSYIPAIILNDLLKNWLLVVFNPAPIFVCR